MDWNKDYFPLLGSMLARLEGTERGPGVTAADIFLDRIQKAEMAPEEKAREAAEAACAALVFLAGSSLIVSYEREQALEAFHKITYVVSNWSTSQNQTYLNSILGYAEEVAEKHANEHGIQERFKQAIQYLEIGAVATGPEISERITALQERAKRPGNPRRRQPVLTEG